ncbi:DNA repair protein RadC [Novosphingobium sp. Rr 2-17]|uniref:JAB domain-containing protein n=1 Tax=Novosphingobium sp. Rr 2-17 TaxID=555793 RepID=UPI00026984ED|nr:JAB domain-containing protein [Novosphingobium sp. Rr 2-17]EIZ79989.1 DNA repair protein RadC [Novosphingobium sp. Rr 2-17]
MAQILPAHPTGTSDAIARRLIQRFGSLRTIYSASVPALTAALDDFGESAGQIAVAIASARRLAEAAARELLQGEPVDTRAPAFCEYLVQRLGARREECVLVLFTTQDGLFIAEDFYSGGGRAESRIPLRRSVRRAFDLDARRVVLAHNHPSRILRPSLADILATKRFRDIVEALDIRLEDHCIVAGDAVLSMRRMGLL